MSDVNTSTPELVLDTEQLAAIEMCCDMSKRLVSVTGEAGTGKTTLIKETARRLQARGIEFAICAPTGKAARRIREATGFPAETIHKLLAFNRPDIDEETGDPTSATTPKYDKQNPLPYAVVIADEYAMVSTGLHRDLVSALPSGGCMRVFGDIRQLPPIENTNLADPTSPFKRCLAMPNTDRIGSVTLKNIYRQTEGNGILEAARQINLGKFFSTNNDIKVHFDDAVLRKLRKFIEESTIDWCSVENQIISPARKSDIGTIRLNAILQTYFNPTMASKTKLPRNRWQQKEECIVALGDKVVCTVNSYDLRDYSERYAEYDHEGMGYPHAYIPCPETKQMLNGEVGRITSIDEFGVLEVDFGDRTVELPPNVQDYSQRQKMFVNYDPRKVIELAYALTTHKCQGSEYKNVVYTMANACFFNLSRPNFYTAITRARHHVDVICDQRSFGMSLRMVDGFKRKT